MDIASEINQYTTLKRDDHWLHLGIAIFILGSIGDTLTTYYGVTSGTFNEANPILATLFPEFGILPTLIIGKLLVGGLYASYPQVAPKYETKLTAISFTVGGLLYLFATYHNYTLF